jgi:hypothetical protein
MQLVIAALVVAACHSGESMDTNTRTVRRLFEEGFNRDHAVIAELVSPD